MKISATRHALLKELCEKPRYVSDTYSPLRWLLEQGLVKVIHEGRYGSTTYGATAAGKKALEELQAA